jgi:hypothetical protein
MKSVLFVLSTESVSRNRRISFRRSVHHGSGTREMRSDLIAFATASAFFGAALYVNVVEQPARLAHDARSMI